MQTGSLACRPGRARCTEAVHTGATGYRTGSERVFLRRPEQTGNSFVFEGESQWGLPPKP